MTLNLFTRHVPLLIAFLIALPISGKTVFAQTQTDDENVELGKSKLPFSPATEALSATKTRVDVAPLQSESIKRLASEQCIYPNVGVHMQNMVATVDPRATDAGLDALRKGGNAIDAAIAACLTLGVVDGYNSGIGGGCFILIRTADGQLHAIDGRETAPSAAHRDFYLDKETSAVNPDQSQLGPKAVAVPGALKALEEAVDQFGNLDLPELLLPAAQIAEDGFVINKAYSCRECKVLGEMQLYPEMARLFLTPAGQPLPPGYVLRQPDLAKTYRNIAEQGTGWFYDGPFAQTVSRWMQANGGVITESDFADYQTVRRQPLRSNYRGYEVIGFPLPSSGGLHVSQMLNILESFPLRQIHEADPIRAIHIVAEAMKLAFADRAYWPGDSAFANVPRSLISREYAATLAAKINPDHVTKVDSYGQPPNPEDVFGDRHTTHISTADAEGNWVAITSTINTSFGSKIVVPGTGVILNNEMDDFSIALGVPNFFGLLGNENNSVEAGKRPLSSMSPTIVLKDGQPVLTVGAAGGPKIITEVLWALIDTIDFGMTPGQIMCQPRIHHQWSPDYLRVETTLPTEARNRLDQFGHDLFIAESDEVGVCQMIVFDPETGRFTGAHDPRVPGKAAGASVESTPGR